MSSIQIRSQRPKNIRCGKQRGYTIVELSVAVAIAGILLVGAISLVQTVLVTSRSNDTVGGLSRVFAQIEKVYNGSQNYSGITTSNMVGAGVFQGPFTLGGTAPNNTVTSRFGYPVNVMVVPNYPAAASNSAYAVSFAGVPQKVCADMVTGADSAGIRAIAIFAEPTPIVPGAVNPNDAVVSGYTAFATASTPALAKGTDNGGLLNTVNMLKACNTPSATVSIYLVSWK